VSDAWQAPANPPAKPSQSSDDVAGWGAVLADALRQTGGALSDHERAWAHDILGTGISPENRPPDEPGQRG
jgi:hypothetical protein